MLPSFSSSSPSFAPSQRSGAAYASIRWRSGLVALALGLAGALAACGDDGGGRRDDKDAGDDDEPAAASCEPGRSVACTGRGGCAGHQVCDDDGRYGACDCSGGGDLGGMTLGDGGSGGSPDGGGGMMTAMCGASCARDADCGGGSCVPERKATSMVEGLGSVTQARFPGGICSQVPLTRYESSAACDPTVSGAAQGCGSCGVCTFEFFADAVATVCREKCTPSATDNGCSRDEYTCSFSSGACLEGQCQTDDECRIYSEDSDNDGLSDTLVYDPMSAAKCNLATRRCQVTGKAGAQAGDPCMRDDDCEADGYCVTESSGDFDVPFAGGYCLKRGCKVSGLECAGQGACTTPRAFYEEETLGTVCARPCELGKEAMADQTGAAGHGNTCRAGYMCMWNGTASNAAGTCMPGNYNAVATNNVGALCTKHADCYSPLGHGRCATMGSELASASFCSVFDCGAPGMPADVCGTGNVCADLGDFKACLKGCTDASTCAAGLACATVATGVKGCVFGCESNAECKTGETCSRNTGACVKGATGG